MRTRGIQHSEHILSLSQLLEFILCLTQDSSTSLGVPLWGALVPLHMLIDSWAGGRTLLYLGPTYFLGAASPTAFLSEQAFRGFVESLNTNELGLRFTLKLGTTPSFLDNLIEKDGKGHLQTATNSKVNWDSHHPIHL